MLVSRTVSEIFSIK